MRNNLLLTTTFAIILLGNVKAQNCDINATASPQTITCGQSSVLSSFGSSSGQVVLDESFNSGGFGSGWGSTPGATNFNNPCSPGGVDGTAHAWMDDNTSVPRTLTSAPYDLTAATAGVSICFDLMFAEQGGNSPCEGPDEPDEGVFVQYSTDGGATWVDIHYFDPNGGNDPQLTNWNNWCFELPPGAITGNTLIRWHQLADSGADYDHWGIDNVQIFQNDVNAEVGWTHDGYTYGVGSPGGENPTPVSPTTTTTYTTEIITGTGDVCTATVTVIVLDPVYDVNVIANPTTICAGDCADITGDATIVLDPGGIETYENDEFELVVSGGASININIQTLNMTGVDPGSIQEICVNGFNFSGTEACTNFGGCNCNGTPINFLETCDIDASSFNITLTSPNGCVITLVPANTIVSTGIQDMCFVPVGGSAVSSGSGNYTGQFDPNDPISNLDGCDANGVWTLEFNTGTGGLGFGVGTLTGWNITFDDPPVYAPVDIAWSPTTGLSNPTSINTDACPASSTDYELTVSNGTAGCPAHTETVSITVDPCGGCIAPSQTIDPLSTCAPGTVDLSTAIAVGSDPATLSYHASQIDAQNGASPIVTTVGTSNSYWVRAEDPTDPTCFNVYEIVVTINPLDDASFTLTDYCEGAANSATGMVTPGGTFSFNPPQGGLVTIDPATGEISNGIEGTTYTVEYTTAGACPGSSIETVDVQVCCNIVLDTTSTIAPSCGQADGEINVLAVGGDGNYTYSLDGGTFNALNSFTGLSAGNYQIEVQDGTGACSDIINVQISDLNAPIISAVNVTQPLCNGDITGEIEVIASGGIGTLDYEIVNGTPVANNTTGEFTGLSAANYTINVRDANGCLASSTGLIVDPSIVTIDIQSTNITCFGANDGTISITGGGGIPAYNYSIDNGVTWTTNTNYTGLSVQNYEVIVEDANGCQSTIEDVNITENGTLLVNTIVVNETCFSNCDGSITLDVIGGNAPYSFSFNGGAPVVSNVVSNLCAGNQSYVVTDASGCGANGSEVIAPGARVEPVLTSLINDGCSDVCDGEITVTSVTGVSYTMNGVTNGTGIFTDLCEGNYTVNVLDVNDCVGTIQAIVSSTPQTVAGFSHLPTSVTIFENSVYFSNTSSNATEYLWEVRGDNGYYETYISEDINHEFPSDTGEYLVCLTAINPIGCQDQYCMTLVVEDDIVVFVPNTFTPDGDEFNQTFRAYVNGVDVHAFNFLIFNRWGELIWENHDPQIGWDGTYKGQKVQIGTYAWKIEVKDIELDFRRTYTGHVTLLK